MRTVKLIDACISLTLIVVFTIDYFTKETTLESLVGSYLITGTWQTISMLFHARNKWFTRRNGCRYAYHWITFVSLVTLPLGSYWILVFTAPFMAVFYTALCFHEQASISRRPLSLLKN